MDFFDEQMDRFGERLRALAKVILPVAFLLILLICFLVGSTAHNKRLSAMLTGEISLSAPSLITRSGTYVEGGVLMDQLGALIAEAKRASVDKRDLTFLFSIDFKQADGRSVKRMFYEDPQHADSYICRREGYYVRLPRASVDAVVTAPALEGLYTYAVPPTLSLSSDKRTETLTPATAQWEVRMLDGQFHTVAPPAPGDAPLFESQGAFRCSYKFSVAPVSTMIEVLRDGQTVFSGSKEEIGSFAPDRDGLYTYRFTAVFEQEGADFRGSCTYEVDVHCAVPRHLGVSGSWSYPGELVTLYMAGGQEEDFAASWAFGEAGVFQYQDYRVALLPVPLSAQSVMQPVEVRYGEQGRGTVKLDLKAKDFEVMHITDNASYVTNADYNRQAQQQFSERIAPLLSQRGEEYLPDGPFQRPLEGEIITPFGAVRYINQSTTGSAKTGIDIKAAVGTPVSAAQRGKVLLAENLTMTGNTVIIEHGFGIKSWYYHLDTLSVQAGDEAEAGQRLGTLGQTGFASSPRLCFSVSVDDVYINPQTAFQKKLIDPPAAQFRVIE
ncbi:M23 family metallopeptidase [Harryflintia acetispora]|uniref:M23 family metallopeptidase n=1 Tax=Harryflintia acetispora TaxID=1849041 RepID=UPI00189AD536